MDIHEIIHAWETNALPADLAALAAIQNKVDDYADKASTAMKRSKWVAVQEMYESQVLLYRMLSSAIDSHINILIPDKPGKGVIT